MTMSKEEFQAFLDGGNLATQLATVTAQRDMLRDGVRAALVFAETDHLYHGYDSGEAENLVGVLRAALEATDA